MMMSTPFALDIEENSMRVTVDGGGVRVASSKDLQRESLILGTVVASQAVAWLH